MADDPIQPYLNEIEKILKTAEMNASRPLTQKVPEGVEAALKRLEILVDQFKEISMAEIEKSGKPPKKMEEYTKKQQQTLKQCLDLGLSITILGGGLMRAKKAASVRIRDLSTNTKKTIQKRRNKFKGIGGKDNWQRT